MEKRTKATGKATVAPVSKKIDLKAQSRSGSKAVRLRLAGNHNETLLVK